jgi:hypothetical protein
MHSAQKHIFIKNFYHGIFANIPYPQILSYMTKYAPFSRLCFYELISLHIPWECPAQTIVIELKGLLAGHFHRRE